MSLDGSRVMTTVGVVGAGRVGASCARAIVRDGLVTRLTIYDRTESYAQGEALDLSHALPMLEPCEIRGRPLTAVEPEDVLVMAFGGHTASGQTRLDLARANLAICEEVAGHVEVGGLPRVSLVATSPLDVLTEYLTRRWAGRMVDVIGSAHRSTPGGFAGSFPRSAAYIRLRCTRGSWASTATPLCCFSVRQQSPASHWRSLLGRRASTCPSSGWQRLPTRCELLHIECANSRARRGTRSDLRSRLWCAASSETTAESFRFRSASTIGSAPVCHACSVRRVRASHFTRG
jgi:hypothetical protein